MMIHESFKNFKKAAVSLVAQYSNLTMAVEDNPQVCLQELQELLDQLCDVYGMQRVGLLYFHPAPGLASSYLTSDDDIAITYVSVFEVLHQLRHLMQGHGVKHYENPEWDARGWAYSLMWQADPETFKAMARLGALPDLSMQDVEPPNAPQDAAERPACAPLAEAELEALDGISEALADGMDEDLLAAIEEFEAGS